MIPRITTYRWGGGDDDCPTCTVEGFGIELRWLGLYLELNFGRRRP